jgi:Domain of unknown function (DUF1836)
MAIQLTRKQMTELLYSLKGESNQHPSPIIEKILGDSTTLGVQIPNFLLKLNKKRSQQEIGLSTNEIVLLANLCELTSLTPTSIQNWIKRDVKEIIGTPDLGKKYSIEQVALLLIVKDLKSVFDFENIRNLLTVVFNTLSDRSDDLMNPIVFYEIYAIVLDSLELLPSLSLNDKILETSIIQEIDAFSRKFSGLSINQWEPIKNVLVVTVLSVFVSHIQTRAQLYLNDNNLKFTSIENPQK